MKFNQESGNYYTLNRYYPPNLGRWLSPDPLGGDVTNPQSLNRYAYVLNNPTTFIDPLGLQDKSNIKLQAGPASSGCTLNGIFTACYVVASLLGAGAALPVGVPSNAELVAQWGNTFVYGWQEGPPSGYVPCPNGVAGCYMDPETEKIWRAQDHYSSATFTLPTSAWSTTTPANPAGPGKRSMGNAAGFQKIGSWNIRHPSPEACGRVKAVTVGTAAVAAFSTLVSMAFPVSAVVAEPVAEAAGINFALFATYYVAFCR